MQLCAAVPHTRLLEGGQLLLDQTARGHLLQVFRQRLELLEKRIDAAIQRVDLQIGPARRRPRSHLWGNQKHKPKKTNGAYEYIETTKSIRE